MNTDDLIRFYTSVIEGSALERISRLTFENSPEHASKSNDPRCDDLTFVGDGWVFSPIGEGHLTAEGVSAR